MGALFSIFSREHFLFSLQNENCWALNDLIDDFASDPDRYLKPHHQTLLDRTAERYLNDDLNLTNPVIDEADLPHAEYEIGSIVKVIDPQEQHTEWAVFEIVERRYNPRCFRTTEAYLSETQWYYQLSSHQNSDRILWARENEICAFDMSYNVCTTEIF